MYRTLNEFIAKLEATGQLTRVSCGVDPELEIAEITDRMAKSPDGGKALLFEHTGTDFPVVTNLYGSPHRMAQALGVERLEQIEERLDALLHEATAPKTGFWNKIGMLPLLAEAARWFPRERSGRGACQQVVMEQPDLTQLPVLKCWPHDAGRFVTLPMVCTTDPETGAENVGMYRMQLFDAASAGMHWHIHKTGAHHYEKYKAAGERMPIAVCLGGDPVYAYCATAPLPENVHEWLLAGFLRGRPVETVRCLTQALRVPADCDFVIEGYVDPTENKTVEGPFGDHTGFYSLEDFYPIFHVTAITHRHGAIYPATLVGIPPQEDAAIAAATERIFLPPIQFAVQPEITDLRMPQAGVAHNLALVSIHKRYPGQSFKTASALWGAGQMMFNKYLFVTDSEVDLSDPQTLAERISQCDPTHDLFFSQGTLDVLDHAAQRTGRGGKLAVDLCQPVGDEPERLDSELIIPDEYELPWEITRFSDAALEPWRTLLVSVSREVNQLESLTECIGRFLDENRIEGVKCVAVFDAEADLNDLETLLWIATAHTDPQRDLQVIGDTLVVDARAKYDGINGFDRRWPNPTVSDAKTRSRVDARWSEYGLGAFLPSPSEKYARYVHGDGAAVE